MIYRTIKAKRFYNYLFDLDIGRSYKIINYGNCCNYGYFLITPYDEENWKMLKQLNEGKLKGEEHIHHLPYSTQLSLFSFLNQNFGSYKRVQKIISSLNI